MGIVRFGHALLRNRHCYDLFQSAVGSYKMHEDFFSSLNFASSALILDLGCGTGDLLKYLKKEARYVGVDFSDEYILKASTKYPTKTFRIGSVSDVNSYTNLHLGEGDIILAMGLFHHLHDGDLQVMFDLCRKISSNGVTLYSIDPVISNETSKMARWVANNDRGKFLRTPEQIESYLDHAGFSFESRIESGLLRIPSDLMFGEAVAR